MSTAVTPVATEQSVLGLDEVVAGYGTTTVLRGVSLQVPAGKVVALLGPNGAGKTTLLRVASGLIRPMSGAVNLGGEAVTRKSPHDRARRGLCLIPEGRGVFKALTVAENLQLAVPPWRRGSSVEPALEAFPILGERRKQVAGTMSGGQQQMLSLARAYLANPTVVLLDEVSMGLAPIIVDEIFESLRVLAGRGAALLLVEQYVNRALALADEVYLLDRGKVRFHGSPDEIDEAKLASQYFGVEE